MNHDLAALCAAIDEGDDEALPILADALEESGDARARGLRNVGNRRPFQFAPGHTWDWGGGPHCGHLGPARLDTTTWHRVPGVVSLSGTVKCYDTRSAAYLALAAALSG